MPPPPAPDGAPEAVWHAAVAALARAHLGLLRLQAPALESGQLQPIADATAASATAAFEQLPQVERMQRVHALLDETRALCATAKDRGRSAGREGESRSRSASAGERSDV